jgi:three-Cys-motif partner protein
MTTYRTDPSDDLPAMEVGDWAAEKADLLRRYVDASRGARAKYRACAYIDLFSGPGRVFRRDAGEFADGCAIAAWRQSVESGSPFSQVIVGDVDQSNVVCCERRLIAIKAPVRALVGKAEEIVEQAIQQLDPYGLHLAFIDPFNLGALPLKIIESLARIKRMDLIVHFSQNDLQRNLPEPNDPHNGAVFEAFAPGWRKAITARNKVMQRSQYFQHWISRVRSLESYQVADAFPLIRNNRNVPLYRLVLFSRHPLGKKLWDDVAKSPQFDLPFVT